MSRKSSWGCSPRQLTPAICPLAEGSSQPTARLAQRSPSRSAALLRGPYPSGLVVIAALRARKHLESVARLRADAETEYSELMAVPAEQRPQQVRHSFTRFRNPILCELLLADCRRAVIAEPYVALSLAECAHEIAVRVPFETLGRAWALTCVSLTHAHRGNALRATGNLREAERALVAALRQFDLDGTGDPLIEAELLQLAASLRSDQQRFLEAEAFLDQAIGLYQRCGDKLGVARTLNQKGRLHFEPGESGSAGALL